MSFKAPPPQPSESGAKGNQSPGSGSEVSGPVETHPNSGLLADPISIEVLELVEDDPQVLKHPGLGKVVGVWQHQLSMENAMLRQENRRLRDGESDLKQKMATEGGRVNTLRGLLKAEIRNRNLRNAAIALGPVLAFWGLENLGSLPDKIAWGLIGFGTIIFILSWMAGTKENEIE